MEFRKENIINKNDNKANGDGKIKSKNKNQKQNSNQNQDKNQPNIKDKTKKVLSDKNINIIFDLIAMICLVVLAIAVSPKTMQNDTYYNIKCGEYIFQNGIAHQNTDPFSWHNLGYTWPHWLFDFLSYIVYAVCGSHWAFGIYASVCALTAVLGLAMYNLSLKLTKNNRVVSLITTLFAIYIMRPYIAARAQLVTFILFVLELYFIEKLLDTNKKRYGLALVAISFLIIQLHCAVWVMFFLFAAPYVAEYLFVVLSELDLDEVFFRFLVRISKVFMRKQEKKDKCDFLIEKSKKNTDARKIGREKRRKNPYKLIIRKNDAVKTLIVFLIIAFLVGFINPRGLDAVTYLFKTYQGSTPDHINEHLPLTLADNMEYAIMLAVIIVILVLVDIKVRLSDLLILGGTVILSFNARRQVAIVVIAGMPILAKLLADFFEKYDYKLCDMLKRLLTSIVGMIATVAIVVYISKGIYSETANDKYIDENSYPVSAVDWLYSYMEENEISKEDLHLYNEYNYGSYILFRGLPVFIDSRAELYTPEFGSENDIFIDALTVPGLNSNYEEIFEKYDVRYVMLYSSSNVNNNLQNDSNYEIIYNDGSFNIYKRLSAENVVYESTEENQSDADYNDNSNNN